MYLIEYLFLDYNNNNLIFYLSDLKYGILFNIVKYCLLFIEEKWNMNYDDYIKFSNIFFGKYVLEICLFYLLEENK